MISKRKAAILLNSDVHLVDTLVSEGALTLREGRLLLSEVQGLIENEHFVVCAECQRKLSEITIAHTRSHELSKNEYEQKHPKAHTSCAYAHRRREKTIAQKEQQSETLKKRFESELGEKTRAEIAEASRRMHRERPEIAQQLIAFNRTPEARRRTRPGNKESVRRWHKENRDRSLSLAFQARQHIKHKRTKPHLMLQEALHNAGLQTVEEFVIEFYMVDEALPDSKIAIEADGCYWHGCPACGFAPYRGNGVRDACKDTFLTNRGWTVFRFKECEIKKDANACALVVAEHLKEKKGAE